jgi:hypothetical protein
MTQAYQLLLSPQRQLPNPVTLVKQEPAQAALDSARCRTHGFHTLKVRAIS